MQEKLTPLKRFRNLLQLDKKDIYQILFYAVFSGFISLSLPLGVQAIINLIQGGRVSISWVILVFVVIIGVVAVGILRLMQLRITENLQQKIFIRSSFEFAYRFPKIKFKELYNNYPPELANRFFDTVAVQKSMAKIILDYFEAALQIVFGLLLLSLYHPSFILFGIILFIVLYLIFRFSFDNGLKTSLMESKYKYKVAHWIQEIARNHNSFKNEIHLNHALNKNDKLVNEYLSHRESHFKVIVNQFKQLIGFKVLITAGLLFVGGYLVINQQINIGQFVASEIIILLVINSVEKIILGLETFYDMLTSIEKIGAIVDMEIEEESPSTIAKQCYASINLELDQLSFSFPNSTDSILDKISLNINQGELIFIDGHNGSGKTTLLRILAGVIQPKSGLFYINDENSRKVDFNQYRTQIGLITAGQNTFEGTIYENITLNNPEITNEKIKWIIEKVGLKEYIKSLPNGIDEHIFPADKQISSSIAQKIILARAMITEPRILFMEEPMDKMDDVYANKIIDFITSPENKWTVVVISKNDYWRSKCNRVIRLEKGKIILDK